jgi:hypothetical protein
VLVYSCCRTNDEDGGIITNGVWGILVCGDYDSGVIVHDNGDDDVGNVYDKRQYVLPREEAIT